MASRLLLIDDDPHDRELTLAEVEKTSDALLVMKRSAGEALEYFDELPRFAQDIPALVFLDLKLPDADGFSVLAELRRRANAWHVPVVVFTDSRSEASVEQSYRLGANAYIVKPLSASAFRSVVKATISFWLNSNTRPRTAPSTKNRRH